MFVSVMQNYNILARVQNKSFIKSKKELSSIYYRLHASQSQKNEENRPMVFFYYKQLLERLADTHQPARWRKPSLFLYFFQIPLDQEITENILF